jgi:hypothetical protein
VQSLNQEWSWRCVEFKRPCQLYLSKCSPNSCIRAYFSWQLIPLLFPPVARGSPSCGAKTWIDSGFDLDFVPLSLAENSYSLANFSFMRRSRLASTMAVLASWAGILCQRVLATTAMTKSASYESFWVWVRFHVVKALQAILRRVRVTLCFDCRRMMTLIQISAVAVSSWIASSERCWLLNQEGCFWTSLWWFREATSKD